MVEWESRLVKEEARVRHAFASSSLRHLVGCHAKQVDSCDFHENVSCLHVHQIHDHAPQMTLYECDRIVRRAKGYNGADTSTQSGFPQNRP